MFNPPFCQELSKLQPARRHPIFPSGTYGVFVGDKREARGGVKDNRLSANRL